MAVKVMEITFINPLQLWSHACDQANKISGLSTNSINWTQEKIKMTEHKGERDMMGSLGAWEGTKGRGI